MSLLHFKGFRDVIVSEPSEGRRNIVKSMGKINQGMKEMALTKNFSTFVL